MKQFIVTKENEGQRFDKYLGRILSNGSMSFIYKMLRKKNFVLNDKKSDGKEILKSGDVIKLYISDETYDKFKADVKLNDSKLLIKDKNHKDNIINDKIIYEDKDIVLINKPAGVLSQKAQANDISINEYVLDYLINKGKITKEDLINYKPSVVNRLDRNTTGIIIVAKNLRSAQILSENLKNRTINKYYKCLVNGHFNKNGIYKAYLKKDNKNNIVTIMDKPSDEYCDLIETKYELLEYDDGISLVNVHLITGKSHQIRAHLAYLGFPIIGDSKYGDAKINSNYIAKNQLLHAYKIVFPKFDEKHDFEFSGKTIECEPMFRY